MSAKAAVFAVFAAQGAFLFGLDIGYIAPILECAAFKRDVAGLANWQDPDAALSSGTVGLIVSTFSIGCLCTSFPLVSRYFLDVWGRRDSIIFGDAIFLVGCACQALCSSIPQMIAGRFITGCAIGLLSAVISLYQSEIAPPALRGTLTSVYQLMITLGILVAAFADTLLVEKDDGWRIAIWLQAIPALALLLGMPCLPRSPRWLVQQGREEEALDALLRIRGDKGSAEAELAEIRATHLEETAALATAGDHWSNVCVGRAGRLLYIGVLLQLLQQLVGMNCFMYFGPRVFRSFGLPVNIVQTSMNGLNFLATFPAVLLADRCGRRLLLASSAAGMIVACTVMGIVGVTLVSKGESGWRSSDPLAAAVMVTMVAMFVVCFAFGWGPLTWVYCAEMFPLRHRSRSIGWTTTANWAGNFLIAQLTPVLLELVGFGLFFLFGAFALAGLCLALWLPETKGVPLEAIDALFNAKVGVGAQFPEGVEDRNCATGEGDGTPEASVLGRTTYGKEEDNESEEFLVAAA